MYVATRKVGEPDNFDPLLNTLINFARRHPTRPLGTTKIEEARAVALNSGYREGVRSAVAEMLNLRRLQAYPLLASIPLVSYSDGAVGTLLIDTEACYQQLMNKNMTNYGEPEFLAEIENLILTVVLRDDLDLVHEQARREGILAHRIDPTPDDADWIDKIRVEREGQLDQIRSIMRRIEA